MKALTFHGKEKLSYETVNDPSILKPTDAIVKVEWAAICGSDLHIYREHEKGLDAGTVMGHEFVGEVVEVGSSVINFKKGDHVVSPFTTSCGQCYYCKIGLTCRCTQGQLYGWRENGHGLHGAQAEYVRVPLADSTLFKLPDGSDHREMLFIGDILSTGYFCADNAGIDPTKSYVVLGCGPVGLMAIIGARELGAENIFAVDSVEERLIKAAGFGAIPINFLHENPMDQISAMTNGRGADAVMEVVGSLQAQRLAIDLVRPGGTISTVGVHTSDAFAFSPVEAYDKNLTFRIGRCPARHYMDRLSTLVADKKYDFSSIISHEMPLSLGAKGYDMFDKKLDNSLKILLKP
ncbi:MAG: alcohol dehydrogenase family protein [Bacteroidetes bacterium]|nr:alcohol dehydrogenase family protein [Bacteroidota bacterium]MDA1121323.1 alcohol dehydrogenase family protein [Bacteroidota bacterium]